MNVPYALACRILRDISYHLDDARVYIGEESIAKARGDRPDRSFFTPPLMAASETLATVYQGRRAYDFLLKVSDDASRVCSFYSNKLRLLGWQRFSISEEVTTEWGGFSRLQKLPSRVLHFYSPHQSLIIKLQILEGSSSETVFILSVNEAAYSTALQEAALQGWTHPLPPVPLLLLPDGHRRRLGSRSGSEISSSEICTIQGSLPLASLFENCCAQIKSLSWDLRDSYIARNIAYSFWMLEDNLGVSWHLFLCLTNVGASEQKLAILSVEQANGRQPIAVPSLEDHPDVPMALLETLLAARDEAHKLYVGSILKDIPALPSFPTEATLNATLQRSHTQWRFLLTMCGSPEAVYEGFVQLWEHEGWMRNEVFSLPDFGFSDAGYRQMSPTFLYNRARSHQRLRLWTRRGIEGQVNVEVLWDVNSDETFSPTEPMEPHDLDGQGFPQTKLEPPSGSAVYWGRTGYGGQRWDSSTCLTFEQGMQPLRAHYEEQLILGGWQIVTQSVSEASLMEACSREDEPLLSASSLTMKNASGERWQGLLYVMSTETINQWIVCFHTLMVDDVS